jgi:DNA-binding Lrp family transcriptional regulator
MDLFDERILAVLSDGKPRVFRSTSGEVGFSRNTLKLYLKRLMTQSLVMKEKTVSNRFMAALITVVNKTKKKNLILLCLRMKFGGLRNEETQSLCYFQVVWCIF